MLEFKELQKAIEHRASIEQIKSKLHIDETIESFMPTLFDTTKENVQDIVVKFYMYLFLQPDAAAVFQDEKQMEHLKQVNLKAFPGIFSTPLDHSYMLQRLRIGFAHYQSGIQPLTYTAAIMEIRRLLLELWQCLILLKSKLLERNITLKLLYHGFLKIKIRDSLL